MSKRVGLFFVCCLLLLLVAAPGVAHESREVGPYRLAFGWRTEPAYVGVMNGPEVYISFAGSSSGHSDDHDDDHSDTPSLADIEVALQVEVSFGGQSTTLRMRPVWGAVGHYVADLVPTRPGDYTFRVFGTIGDTQVDEVFASADGKFDTVDPLEDIMFPRINTDAEARITALEARIAELEDIIAELRGD